MALTIVGGRWCTRPGSELVAKVQERDGAGVPSACSDQLRTGLTLTRQEERKRQALKQLQELGVLMHAGHYDYGNGYHGRAYLNPHRLFVHPSTIWRLAQDLLDVLPGELLERTEVVAGPVMGGALLAHTMSGLLDGRRALTPPARRASRRSPVAKARLRVRPA